MDQTNPAPPAWPSSSTSSATCGSMALGADWKTWLEKQGDFNHRCCVNQLVEIWDLNQRPLKAILVNMFNQRSCVNQYFLVNIWDYNCQNGSKI